MNIQGNVILALSFILMLSTATVEHVISYSTVIECLLCKTDKPNVGCQPEDTCFSSKYCFLQKQAIKGKGVTKINQGCTSVCRDYLHGTRGKYVHVWCCRTDMCNRYRNTEEDSTEK